MLLPLFGGRSASVQGVEEPWLLWSSLALDRPDSGCEKGEGAHDPPQVPFQSPHAAHHPDQGDGGAEGERG